MRKERPIRSRGAAGFSPPAVAASRGRTAREQFPLTCAGIAVAVVLVACTRAEAPLPKRVHTPPRYGMSAGPYGPQLTMRTTLRAPADRPLYVVNCNGAMTHGLQRLEGGTWRDAWVAEINGCYSPPVVIPSGGRHTAIMTVVSRPETWTVTPGTYRAVWHNVLLSVEPHEELPLAQRVSAPFVIER